MLPEITTQLINQPDPSTRQSIRSSTNNIMASFTKPLQSRKFMAVYRMGTGDPDDTRYLDMKTGIMVRGTHGLENMLKACKYRGEETKVFYNALDVLVFIAREKTKEEEESLITTDNKTIEADLFMLKTNDKFIQTKEDKDDGEHIIGCKRCHPENWFSFKHDKLSRFASDSCCFNKCKKCGKSTHTFEGKKLACDC
tara:strand:+ start:83 stop:673 length:591 start_codon:yes stop_codon:yes gene_type:complete